MEKEAKFWDKIAQKYAGQPIGDEEAYQKKLIKTREYFTPEAEVFEFGCGTGSTALLHAGYVKHIHATDISAAMIGIAKEKAEAQKIKNVAFEQATLDELAVDDNSKDVVLAHSIFHLVNDKDDALTRVYRMLKPGGVLVSSTPCVGETMGFIKYIAPIGRLLGFFPSFQVFSINDFRRSITEAGFTLEYDWQVGKTMVVFVVARKPLDNSSQA